MPIIRSVQNQRIKDAVKLRRSRQRQKQGRFLIDGLRELRRAIDGGIVLDEVFVCPAMTDVAAAHFVTEQVPQHLVHETTAEVFAKLAFGDRSEGVVAAAVIRQHPLEALRLEPNPLIAVVQGIEKPGNLGAVLRTIDGAGLSALIVADPLGDLYNPNTIRASLGAIFTAPIATASSEETIRWLKQREVQIYAAIVEGACDYTQADFRGPAAIVLGSEAQGLDHQWRRDDVTAIKIPMHGVVDSLNVSTAAAIVFYEAVRQRTSAS